jgi:hypothetical protein
MLLLNFCFMILSRRDCVRPWSILVALALWFSAPGSACAALIENMDFAYSTNTTNLTDDLGWRDGLPHQMTANNGAVVQLGNGAANAGRIFIGYRTSAGGNGDLTMTCSGGAPGAFYLNGYNSADAVVGRLGHVNNGNFTGTLTINGGVNVVMGNRRLRYDGGANLVNVLNGVLDYSTAGFGFARATGSIGHIVGTNGFIIVNGLISSAAGFSNWAVTNNGSSVGAGDITVAPLAGYALTFAQNSPSAGKTTIAATLLPPTPPVITAGPQPASYMLGEYLIPLTVTASGSLSFSYQWLKDGAPLPNATNASFAPALPLAATDAGNYAVVVSNAAGSVTSAPPATITVLALSNVTDQAAAIVGRYQSAFPSAPAQIPNDGAVDAPLLGNGSMLAALGGQPGKLQYYVNRSDQWVMQANGGGGPRPLSRLDVSLPALQGAAFNVRQDFLHGLTTGQFTNGATSVNMESAVAATGDLLWVLLSTTSGSVTGRADLFIAGGAALAENSNHLQLGREQYGSGRWYLDGLLDEACIYSRALSAAEIATLSATQNISDSLVRRWTFDNVTNSTVPDVSGSGADGTLVGGVSLTNGVAGSAVNLNGSSGYVDTPACQVQSGVTVSAFINVRSIASSGNAQYIFSKGDWSQGWSLGLSGPYLRMAVGSAYAQAVVAVPTNQWLHVAGTYDGSVLRAYINGQLVAVAGDTNSLAGASGATQVVERDFLTGVSVPDAAASALRVVGSSDRTFVVTSNQPVLLVVSSESLMVTNNFRTNAINAVDGFQMADLAPLRASHLTWWSNFWGKSFVEIPDQTLMQRYYLSQYVMASASRNPNFPPGLQGWVTTDNPMWSGDYHLNYNFEAAFYGLYAANHVEQADPYNQPVLDIADAGRQLGPSQLGIAGIYLPVGIAPKGNIVYTIYMGQKSNAGYACVPMAQRWYSTRDLGFAVRAYPFFRDVAQFWENYLVFQGGRYVDPNDSVQESSGNDTNPIVSLSFIRLVLNCALDMSTALGVDASRQPHWQDILANLSAYPTCRVADIPSNLWPSQLPHTTTVSNLPIFRYTESGTAWWADNTVGIQHIYPGNGIGLDSPPDLLQRATNQIYVMSRWIDGNGMSSFFPAAARVGYDPSTILSQMSGMVASWGWGNGFYSAGGGWMENLSVVPNTLQEMLMQSQEGVIRFFPCWPTNLDARFGTLRAYGAFLVTAQQHNGLVDGVHITSEQGYPCTIQNPWPSQPVAVTRNGLLGEVVSGARFTLPTALNETLELAPASGYALWAQQIPVSAPRNPSADADGDGFANLLEYATGGNPSVPDSQSRLSATVTNGVFELGFSRDTNSVDVTIVVESTATLGSGATWLGVATNQFGLWSGAVPVQETGSGNPRRVTVLDASAPGARFYRLRVTQP